MRRSVAIVMAALGAAASVLGGSAPAWAHDSVAPSTVVAGEPVTLTMSVTNEDDRPTGGIELRLPPGFTFTSAEDVPGWTSQPVKRPDGSVTAIRWTGGVVLPNAQQEVVVTGTAPPSAGRLVWSAAQKAVGAKNYVAAPPTSSPTMTVRAAALGDDTAAVEDVPLAVPPEPAIVAPVDEVARSRATLALVLAGLALLGVLVFGSGAVRRLRPGGDLTRASEDSGAEGARLPRVGRDAVAGTPSSRRPSRATSRRR